MAIGKGSMERASKAVNKPVNENDNVKKPTVKKTTVKKAPEKTVVEPTEQVMDIVMNDRIEVGDEMPIYFY